MASPKNLPPGNPNNTTADPRVIWEDGIYAIIEASDYPPGIERSRTCGTIGEAVAAVVETGLVTAPGPKSAAKLIKVPLAHLLRTPAPGLISGTFPNPKTFAVTGTAPPSPFLPKPWSGKNVPDFPHVCIRCGGRYYQGLSKVIHEATEHSPLAGACPGPAKQKGLRA